MLKISRISQYIRYLILFLAGLQLLAFILVALLGENTGVGQKVSLNFGLFYSDFNIDFNHAWQDIAKNLQQEYFNTTLILGAAELLPYFLIYYFLWRLFSYYQRGEIFTVNTIYCLKMLGKTLLFWLLLNLIYPVLVAVTMRIAGLSDTLPIILNFGSTELTYLLLGSVVYVIAWVMQEGLLIQEQQELVI
ncbi:DUF2975 domain-containing protein [Colwellia sp. PAMC 21821]|uniref:DUF2975 domain-containing protein n=1 Tax=Colwellia sp. PAMC 21821 TaxID=1816219 RepID=UPI0009BC9A95|nr:DUF2975 domain-containing protein [Colwellia sp. PAMC 21821]ARD45586.1 hypothetical protein A3Q33_15630 [Colwellia sp. PAMC 21821]